LYECTDGTIPIIGVGGVEDGHDAYEKFKAGASLVQVYSSLVYGGPGLVSRIRDDVAKLMIENGQRDLQNDVVGIDHEQIFWKKQRAAADLKLKKQDEKSQTIIA
jgi:dihydroorotate dehydrogenase